MSKIKVTLKLCGSIRKVREGCLQGCLRLFLGSMKLVMPMSTDKSKKLGPRSKGTKSSMSFPDL
ncbi:hypothetical protein NQ318_005436 [Aromia moschata]|uniref:Uncharacterized protein n=1 Tax=Aromia moschata TaxID=1265417 RepID=A0AAV8YWZ8_9CUCU|nr:hypothetical protein NQ318_005436 [Aromia moschata]